MTNIVTNKFKLLGAANVIDNIVSTTSNLYIFTGKCTAWSTTNDPPTPTDSTAQANDDWTDMIALKRLTSDDIRYVIPTNQWESGTTYAPYDDKSNVYEPSFVLADRENYRVYKCIDNNNNSASTVKPTGTLTTIFETADGYYWKYMYTISSDDIVNFLTANWMPVQTLSSDDSGEHGNQWNVQQASLTEGIEHISLLNGGSGYTKIITSTSLSASPSSTMTLNSSVTTDNYFRGASVYMHKNDGTQHQVRFIKSYVANTSVATLSSNWNPAIDYTDGWSYVVSPSVLLNGDGSGAVIQPSLSAGVITDFTIYENGTGYHVASPSITGAGGSGATASVKISPNSGHGSNAVRESYCNHIMIRGQIDYDESGFPQVNDYRKIGLAKNISSYGTTTIAGASETFFTAYSTISTTSESAQFLEDEMFAQTLVSETTGLQAKGIVIEHNTSATNHYLRFYQNETTGFTAFSTTTGDPTYGVISDSNKTATIGSFTAPTVEKYLGDILYIEQRTAVERDGVQNEVYKIVIEF
jgi:hypothetical protein